MLAHELSHVAHKDVQVMTVAGLLGITAGLLVRFAFYSELFGGRRGGGNNSQAALLIPLIMLVSIVVYAISFVLIRMLSRYRELAADRSGALLTGQPSALSSALVKVSGQMSNIPNEDLRKAAPMSAFYFAPAMKLTAPAATSWPTCSPPTRRWRSASSSWRRSRPSSTTPSRVPRAFGSGFPRRPARPDQAGPAEAG